MLTNVWVAILVEVEPIALIVLVASCALVHLEQLEIHCFHAVSIHFFITILNLAILKLLLGIKDFSSFFKHQHEGSVMLVRVVPVLQIPTVLMVKFVELVVLVKVLCFIPSVLDYKSN